jgi:uncharacterized membrane protein
MINKTAYIILIILFFAFTGVSQGEGTNKLPKIVVVKIKPIKSVTTKPPKIKVVKSQLPKMSVVITPVVSKPKPIPSKLFEILWTDNCDPRTDSERCSISPRETVTAGFYDVIKSVNAKITYKFPDSLEELASYKVVVVRFCSDDNNEEKLVDLIKQYLQSGGSVFILGGNSCQPAGHPTSWWASQITKDFGVTFGSKDDYKDAWADAVGSHPITIKLNKMYFSPHTNLNVFSPAESVLSVNEQPIAAVYTGAGSFVALADDVGFGWQPNRWENLGATDNFTFWRNSLRWLISRSKTKKSKNVSDENSDTSSGLIVYVKQKDVDIFIDDISYDVRYKKSPFKFDSLSPGTYTIKIEKTGYKTETRTITLKHKQKLLVKYDLIPIAIR